MHAQDKYVANIEIVRFLKQTQHWEIRINSNNHKLNILQKIAIVRCRVNPVLYAWRIEIRSERMQVS